MFEAVSAFGTVGLSTGITPGLGAASKLILVALMFVGRVGPLTLVLAIGPRQERARFRYAEENVMVG
jgi:trk system potassium uptake protein TrkH